MKALWHAQYQKESGAALVVVLSILVLLTAVMVAFMSSTKNELSATVQYSTGQEVHALSEMATSLVMGQIREATLSGIDGQGRGRHTWASQPGALRVWDDGGGNNFVQLYKLYSASQMKEADMDFLNSEIPNDWRDREDEYVDLNEPVLKGTKWHYPILNPAALGVVDGFSSDQTNDTAINWDTRTSMPVRWLYVNRDGEMSNSLRNDSVGRLAFWTDDETCKVNINTAAANADESPIRTTRNGIAAMTNRLGASFWTVPYSRVMQEYNYGAGNPSQGEYQRYVAHPSSVNLIPILQGAYFLDLTERNRLEVLRSLFELLPRYKWGGSENQRSAYVESRKNLSGNNKKQERLYASVDEFAFAVSSIAGERSRNVLPNLSATPASDPTDQERLDYLRFFLTATSRAPDLNLFGQPRVSLWPISAINDAQHRTAQDNLIAFCASLGDKGNRMEYFFRRLYPFSQTADWTEFPRNQKIFEYLQRSVSRDIPGFGGNFVTKYDIANGGVAGEMNQILTAMFDTIRIANLNETFEGRPSTFQSYTPDTPIVPEGTPDNVNAYEAALDLLKNSAAPPAGRAGAGMVLPILTPYGRGAGRVPVLSEIALFAMQRGTKETDANGEPTGNVLPSDAVQTALLFETFTPTLGFMPWTPRDFQLSAKTGTLINGISIFPNADTGVTSAPFNRTTTEKSKLQPLGGTDGFMMPGPYFQNNTNYIFSRRNNTAIPVPDSAMALTGADVQVSLIMKQLQPDGSQPLTPYQNYELQIPSGTLPRPEPVVPSRLDRDGGDWDDRGASSHMGVHPNDVAHSLVPRDGDYRIMAYLQDIPHQFFRPHPDFGKSDHFAHSLRFRRQGAWAGRDSSGEYGTAQGTTNGTFVNLPFYYQNGGDGTSSTINNSIAESFHPDIPKDITDILEKGWDGDWNNGIASYPDGAYLYKPDEGQRRLGGNPNYFDEYRWSPAEGFYSPTMSMPSAGVFGSIPTAVRRTAQAYSGDNFSAGRPWRTLLFCPNPDVLMTAGRMHYGASSPPDYLLAELFNLPVVEPYAISEPLSTAGRINMNYQIIPFVGIERSTALHALFSGQRVSAYPNDLSVSMNTDGSQGDNTRVHHEINTAQTLLQFVQRFSSGDIFRSATEICSLFLVPDGIDLNGIEMWWRGHRMTGDNVRERPYTHLMPLLTTKSNTYTVHVRAQTLAPGTNKVTGEYRGSNTIERYIDPADSRIGTEIDPDRESLEPLYRFRVVDTKRFAP